MTDISGSPERPLRPGVSTTQITWAVSITWLAALACIGLAWPGSRPLFSGWKDILVHPGILVSDFMAIGGPKAAMVNASSVGFLGLLIVALCGAPLSGPTVAAVFMMAGFGLFGKTPLNILPITLGVYIRTRSKGQPLKSALSAATFGTALAPVVSQVAFGIGWGIVPGILIGIAAGFLLYDTAMTFFPTHNGLNLYNIGFACGFVGTFIAAILSGLGHTVKPILVWSTEFHGTLIRVFFVYFSTLIVLGLILSKDALRGFKGVMRQPGTLISDFIACTGLPGVLVNMGAVGLVAMGYIVLSGGVINGPTLGALLTIMGWGAFGKHPANMAPIMAGVYLATLVTHWSPNQPGPLLGALFGTALAPVAGVLGPMAGIMAGFLHLNLVVHVGIMHGGMNLYNNGFSTGLVAAMISVLAQTILARRQKPA